MRDIILRETDRGWLPIIREQNDYQEWVETGRGSFYPTTGEALDAAERMLDEQDIIRAQGVKPCNYKHEDLGSGENCPDCGVMFYSPEPEDASITVSCEDCTHGCTKCDPALQAPADDAEWGDSHPSPQGFLLERARAQREGRDGSIEYPIDPPHDAFDSQNIPEGK